MTDMHYLSNLCMIAFPSSTMQTQRYLFWQHQYHVFILEDKNEYMYLNRNLYCLSKTTCIPKQTFTKYRNSNINLHNGIALTSSILYCQSLVYRINIKQPKYKPLYVNPKIIFNKYLLQIITLKPGHVLPVLVYLAFQKYLTV